MSKPGRPKGSRNSGGRKRRTPICSGLRLKYYEDMPSCDGGARSGYADQYGRIMEFFMNEKGDWDIKPSGFCIAVKH